VKQALELPPDVQERLAELRILSEAAEKGDKEARRELRKALRESSPEVVAKASDFAKKGQRILAETISASDPLMEEAICAKLDLMRTEVCGENPTPLEVLLTERVVSSWLLVEVLETLMNAQLKRGQDTPRVSPSYLKFIIRWLESAHRRHLAAIRSLAQVRRLQSGLPNSQTNIQLNLGQRPQHRKDVS
jgi:histone H3/H4